MEFKVEESKKIDDGSHKGVVVGIIYRDEPYKYSDILIEMSNVTGVTLKVGYPSIVMPESRLGQLLKRFGAEIKVGTTVDPEKILVGKNCQFVTISETTPKGTFARIVPESLKAL